ncbi:MAG: xanthine dehydrogenase family protein subunit M [Halobacteriaceae archaeon]
MFPDEFDYHAPDTVAAARELVADADGEVELLAGGHSLIPTMKSGLSSPDVLVDIGDIPALAGVTETEDALEIGATTTYADVLEDGRLASVAPAFAAAIESVGDRQVRNRGTVGGNLAHADPASDLPGAALAVDATVTVRGDDGERSVPADEFFLGMYMTAVDPGELVTTVSVPKRDERVVGAYQKKPSPSSGYAMVGVAVDLTVADAEIVSAGVGANGVMDHGVRLDPVEDALTATPVADVDPEAVGERATEELDTGLMMDDLQASAEFRAALLETYTERAVAEAIDAVG